MKDPNCTPCQEWELCPFHPADEPPATERSTIGVPMADVPAHAAIVRDPLSAEALAVLDGLKQAARSRQDIRQALVKAGHCAAEPDVRTSFSLFWEGELITVHPAPDATAAELAELIAAKIPGATAHADGTVTVTRPAPNWRDAL